MCYHAGVYFVCTLLNIASNCDLSVLSMSVMRFNKKIDTWGGGRWVGGVNSIQFFIFGIF